ncbi:MAG: transglycosylase SLT domain-containing protein [Cellvibrio sp.]|uniref:transglycosylase SLT domain-containing protein n=1 Tax=Cellvibrio sp. TaxID=1965322 RepID=UPI0031A7AAD2
MSIVSLSQPYNRSAMSGSNVTANNGANQLQVVAEQFEALFLQQVLKQMRKAGDALAAENPMRSREMSTMNDFYDGALADTLASKKQTGIADLLVAQLSGKGSGMSPNEAAKIARSSDLPQRSSSQLSSNQTLRKWQQPPSTADLLGISPARSDVPVSATTFNQLVSSVIRQESGGRVDAVSPKGALGVMQLMPATARHMAGELGIAYDHQRLTRDASYNKQLGSAFLSKMLDRYDGEPALAVAAYNAGPGRVDDWLQRHGDPRTGDVSTANWVARIPFEETRNYTRNILRDLNQQQTIANSVSVKTPLANTQIATPFNSTDGSVALEEKTQEPLITPPQETQTSRPLTLENTYQSRSAAFAQVIRIDRTETEL